MNNSLTMAGVEKYLANASKWSLKTYRWLCQIWLGYAIYLGMGLAQSKHWRWKDLESLGRESRCHYRHFLARTRHGAPSWQVLQKFQRWIPSQYVHNEPVPFQRGMQSGQDPVWQPGKKPRFSISSRRHLLLPPGHRTDCLWADASLEIGFYGQSASLKWFFPQHPRANGKWRWLQLEWIHVGSIVCRFFLLWLSAFSYKCQESIPQETHLFSQQTNWPSVPADHELWPDRTPVYRWKHDW